MPVYNKPQFNSVWAANGEKTAPTDAKINQGWVVEIPPHQYENWISNRQDQMLAHINQYGVVEWDSSTEYQANKSYVQGVTTGNVYRALTTNTGVNPETDVNNNWAIAFERSGLSLLKSQNLADVPDKAAARTNLGIATTADYDARYLLKSANFADIPNKSSARGNLEVYSRQEVLDLINAMTPAGEVSAFARTTAPDGWMVCDGAIVSRTTYARLFAAIGTTFGAGNGTTTFRLPDLRGEFIRGADGGRGVDAGRGFGTFQDSENKAHNHPVSDPGHDHVVRRTGNDGNFGIFDQIPGDTGPYWESKTNKATTGITISSSGATESRPRNIALLYCIRT